VRKGLLGLAVVVTLGAAWEVPATAAGNTATVPPPPTPAAEQQAATLCAQGDRLRADGRDDDARADYEKALGVAWDAPCVPEGLDRVTHGAVVRAGTAVIGFVPTLLIGLAALGIATALVLMVGYLPYRVGGFRRTRRSRRCCIRGSRSTRSTPTRSAATRRSARR